MQKIFGFLELRTPITSLKPFLELNKKEILTEEARKKFVRSQIIKELKKQKNKNLGFYIGLLDFRIISIKESLKGDTLLDINCFFEALYYQVSHGQIILARVETIDHQLATLKIPNVQLPVLVPLKDLDSETITYFPNTKSVSLKNGQKIKEKDYLKVKISILNLHYTENLKKDKNEFKYQLRGSCAGKGYGKWL